MSTKGLIADHRVAEVTLNEAGKAATLTLAPGWTFDNSSGPFTLASVTHGHDIVKGAINPNAPGRAKRTQSPTPQRIALDGSPLAPPAPSPATLAAIQPRKDIEAYIYRMKLSSANHETTGWIRTTRAIEQSDITTRARDLLSSPHASRFKGQDGPTRASGKLWAVDDERAARKANDSGCPWPSVFRPGASTKDDLPTPEVQEEAT